MDASLNMSLDDMIKKSNNQRFRGRGRGFRPGRGPRGSFNGGSRMTRMVHRGPLRVNARPSSFNTTQSLRRTKNFPWQKELLDDSLRAAGIPGIESGTKLYVFNLDIGVSNEDIRELFSEIGELRRYAIHYDKNGRPSGSAEVVYVRRSDAFSALKRYNNVQLDGRPMRIEVVGAKSEVPVSARVDVIGGVNGRRRTVVMPGMVPRRAPPAVNRGFGQRNHRGARTGRGGRGRGWGGRGRGRAQPAEKSADELNKELDNYHAEAMET